MLGIARHRLNSPTSGALLEQGSPKSCQAGRAYAGRMAVPRIVMMPGRRDWPRD
jgi:hypothetical protein